MHKPNSIFEAAANILFREAVEISDEDLKVINSVKKAFPSGSKINTWSGALEWDKSGGYAGEKSLATAREKLEKLGFKYSNAKLLGLPDGSTAGFNTILVNKKLGWYVTLVQFYGQTKSSNSYSITLKKLPSTKSEAVQDTSDHNYEFNMIFNRFKDLFKKNLTLVDKTNLERSFVFVTKDEDKVFVNFSLPRGNEPGHFTNLVRFTYNDSGMRDKPIYLIPVLRGATPQQSVARFEKAIEILKKLK